MSASKDGITGASWFWGIVLSLSLHIGIFLMAIFWGFGTPMYSGEPEAIEGTLVTLPEIGQSDGEAVTKEEEIRPQEPDRKEEPKSVEEEKPAKLEKKEPQEETKKTELKKEETPKEKPKEDETIVPQEKKKEKKEIAKKPEPTEPPKTKSQKNVEKQKESFEDVKNRVIGEMQKQKLLKELEQKRVASAGSSGEQKVVQKGTGYSTGGPSSGSSGVVAELFVRRVREEIRSNWAIPENIPIDSSLKAVIVFKLDERGKVSDVKVDLSSGNTSFDDFCVKAIYKASPLTPPPPELLEEAKNEGLEITFTP